MESDTTEDNLNDSTIPIGAANELLRDLLYRRKHYEANCRHIAVRRDDLYKEIPINHLIPLAFHTSTSLLESLEHIDAAVQAVSKQYKSDIFSDWQKYCKALDTENRAVATFEGAIFFAAENVPDSNERAAWISSCHSCLRSLKQLVGTSINGSGRSGRKRKRRASQPGATDERAALARSVKNAASQAQGARQVEATNIVRMARVDQLESTLGSFLFIGITASCIRHREKDEELMKAYTDTVRLHLAHQQEEDSMLEVWLCSWIGKAISEAKMRSAENLRNMLGDYLFKAMVASNWRKKENTGLECTGAVNVSFPSGRDSKLEVMLCFATGIEVWAKMYPS